MVENKRTYIIPSTVHTAVALGVGYPFDTIKIRLQSGKHKTYVECLRQTLRQDKIRGFYRGVLLPASILPILRPLEFQAYEMCKRQFPSWYGSYIGGFGAGCISSVLSCPMHTIKIKMQNTGMNNYKNTLDCISQIYNKKGLFGFYQGFSINVLKDLSFCTMFFGTYGIIKDRSINKITNIEIVNNFISGLLSGCITWTILSPLDTIRTKIQSNMNPISIRMALQDVSYNNMFKNLWRGLPMSYVRIGPVSGLSMMSYELAKKYSSF